MGGGLIIIGLAKDYDILVWDWSTGVLRQSFKETWRVNSHLMLFIENFKFDVHLHCLFVLVRTE